MAIDQWADRLAALRTVRIDRRRCLPLLSPRCDCTACREICPEGAIDPGRAQVKECSTCGLCAAVCPADAIRLDDPSDQEILHRAAELARRSAQLTLVCREGGADGLKVGCLGRLSPELLLAAVACGFTAVSLVRDPGRCRACPCGHGMALAEEACRAAQGVLDRLHHPARLRLAESAEPPAGAGRPSSPAERPLHGERRRFLLAAFDLLREALPLAPRPAVAEPAEARPNRRRDLLLWAAERLGEAGLEGAPWGRGSPALQATCHHCGVCQRLCPNGALQSEGGALTLTPGRCHSCGLCLRVCPTGALVMGAPRPLGEILSGAALPLGTPASGHCARCGEEASLTLPAAAPEAEPLCLPCSLRRPPASPSPEQEVCCP
ncbi:MAG: 4Fe-4S binding protein [Bacillota bacterium]